MAFAIIETGGKQYKIAEGDSIAVEKLGKKIGETVTFDTVLVLDDGTNTKIGTPYIKDASVEVELSEEGKGKKLHIRKFKSKSRYSRRLGHRQPFSKITVKKIK